MSLPAEYRAQLPWRAWDAAIGPLPIEDGSVVLDLGCGIGDVADLLAARGASVLGIDADHELLSLAVKRNVLHSRFIQADLGAWTDPSIGADGLWSSFTAAYFPDFAPVLRRWMAAVRPGGWVALTEIDDLFGHGPVCAETRDRFDAFYRDALDGGRYDFLAGRKLETYALGTGLEVLSVTDLPDRELAFRGRAEPAVLQGWTSRLNRMKTLQRFLGEDFEAVKLELINSLSSLDHISTSRVVHLFARKPR